ncbi:hypothetical protein H8B22_11635 [Lysobacter terrestris]|uniref:DUF4403 family protein n=1 Tax=Agrilutibacter terrestris TaxID=2865112 RepID=A0A7H0G1N6_9GAMM|nr:hypothetical protein H8B22_11635 [Lysobacter terrestris]
MLSLALLYLASAAASAAALPITLTASGNHAQASIGSPTQPIAELSLDFQDATGLSASSLGVTASLVDPLDPALLARLPSATLTTLPGALPLLVTIEPPAAGGLSFRNTGRLEIHTHAIPYSIGSSFRVFKAPLGGAFRDVTDEIAQGSVRARTTYGGFSQFLILVDVRNTADVVEEKLTWLRAKVAALPAGERPAFDALLDQAEAGADGADYAAAITAIDALRARAQARAGQQLANEWRATRDVTNQAGELVAGANTLRFSVAYLRDFGQ